MEVFGITSGLNLKDTDCEQILSKENAEMFVFGCMDHSRRCVSGELIDLL